MSETKAPDLYPAPSKTPWTEVDWHDLPHVKSGRAIVSRYGKKDQKLIALIPADITKCRGVKDDYTMFCDHHQAWANSRLLNAAPDLLAALRAIEAGFADGSIQFTKKRQSDSEPYHPANVLMCVAFAKVEGRDD